MYTNEEMECKIDEHPDEYDFLGQSIDTGFRVAKFSTPDKMFMCLETAYLLCKCLKNNRDQNNNSSNIGYAFEIGYSGKEVLKGVLNSKPYPLFYIHTNTDPIQNKLDSSEAKLIGSNRFIDLCDAINFMEDFFEKEKISKPLIDGPNSKEYEEFRTKWLQIYQNQSNDNKQRINEEYFTQFSESEKEQFMEMLKRLENIKVDK